MIPIEDMNRIFKLSIEISRESADIDVFCGYLAKKDQCLISIYKNDVLIEYQEIRTQSQLNRVEDILKKLLYDKVADILLDDGGNMGYSIGTIMKAVCVDNKWGYTDVLEEGKEYLVEMIDEIMPGTPLVKYKTDENKWGACHLSRFKIIEVLKKGFTDEK